MVFLWGQTSGTPGEGCRASLPASDVQKWELKTGTPGTLHIKTCLQDLWRSSAYLNK